MVNPTKVGNIALFFNCTPAGRISDFDGSDLVTYLSMRWLGLHVVYVVRPTGVQRLDYFLLWYSVVYIVESVSLFYLFLYLVLYLLGVDTSISMGSFMRTKYLFVLIHIGNTGEVGTVKHVYATGV